jgi:hypothetical protein
MAAAISRSSTATGMPCSSAASLKVWKMPIGQPMQCMP